MSQENGFETTRSLWVTEDGRELDAEVAKSLSDQMLEGGLTEASDPTNGETGVAKIYTNEIERRNILRTTEIGEELLDTLSVDQ